MRDGGASDDFVLSAAGLLYVRPEGDEPALLVPPRGGIRVELLEDAHVGCVGAERMVDELGSTFWWPSIEGDVRIYVAQCGKCKGRPRQEDDAEGLERPYTGVTAWTQDRDGELAADMAMATRKAAEDAEKAALG